MTAAALAASLGACGSESASNEGEPSGRFQLEVADARFPTEQQLGQTTRLRLTIENTGERTVPALGVTMSLAGEQGEGASLPFTVRDPQPDLAQPDRPVWVLSYLWPRLVGSSEAAGSSIANQRTFVFGPVKAGETVDAVWQLSAVRTGKYTLLYSLDAGIGGKAKAVTEADTKPGGSFTVRITAATPNTIVTDSGEVVEIGQRRQGGKTD